MFSREPAIWMAVVRAVLYAAATFGLKLSPEQMLALIGVAETVTTLVTRRSVTPTSKLPPPKDPPADDPPSTRPSGRPPLIPAAMLSIAIGAVLFVACGAALPASRPPGECDEVRMAAITAECGALRARECPGMSEDDVCPGVDAECDARLDKECQTP